MEVEALVNNIMRKKRGEVPSEALEELRKKSAEEIAEEVLKFAEKKFKETPAPWLSYREVIDAYWSERKIDTLAFYREASARRDLYLKLNAVSDIVRKRLDEVLSKKRLEEQEKQLRLLVPKVVEWAKTHKITKITRTDIDIFLMEEKITPPSGAKTAFRDMLYRLVTRIRCE
ncbi:MAG: hypothetical protein ACTSXC_04380 [Candidatus Freyarchaeota archaeon]